MAIRMNSPKRLVSWNVNGIRACLKKGFVESVQALQPEVLCLQESKLGRDQPPEIDLDCGRYIYHHQADRPGYSGTSVFSLQEPLSVEYDLGLKKHKGEGRAITLEFADYFLVNAYVPNSQNELRRLDYRCKDWEPDVRRYLQHLGERKAVIYCGDMNVAHQEIDLARPSANRRSAGFTDEERAEFGKLLDIGLVDTFRCQHPEEIKYSWWSYRAGARTKNVGWRIDYFLISESAIDRVERAEIHDAVLGSDHCPVSLVLR